MNTRAQIFAESANGACLRFWKDERGSVFAVSVICYLCLFMMAMGIYALGETIRKRAELQNTADAAAYSGSVVQADGWSRLAAVNRALGWVHIQMGRAEMDLAVDVWLKHTIKEWEERERDVQSWATQLNCPLWRVGNGFGPAILHGQITINRNQRRWIHELRAIYNGAPEHKSQLQRRIDGYRDMIIALNTAAENLVDEMHPQIEQAVEQVVQADMAESRFEGEQDLRYSLISSDATDYVQFLEVEKDLIVFSGLGDYAKEVFEDGIDDREQGVDGWFVLEEGPDGIHRYYRQKNRYLVSEWNYYAHRFAPCYGNPCCIIQIRQGHDELTGEDAKNKEGVPDKYYETEPVKTWIVGMSYFEKPGSLSVGVARRINNPFERLLSDRGTFRAFTVDEGRSKKAYMWAAASARAGYLDIGRGLGGSDEGNYNPTIDSHWITAEAGGRWRRGGWQEWRRHEGNLMISDWDGVLMPIARAWSPRDAAMQSRGPEGGVGGNQPGRWQRDTSGTVMQELWSSSEWQGVNGGGGGSGLRSWASDQAPSRMSGTQNYGGADRKQVLH